MTTVIIDLMGGDQAPLSTISALRKIAERFPSTKFIAVGTEECNQFKAFANVDFISTAKVVTMETEPMQAVKMADDSSMGYCLKLLHELENSVLLSAGNTAALMTLSYMRLREKEGKRRPAIMSKIEFDGSSTWILDLGANIESTSQDLFENALHGAKALSNPSIKLLNIGSEPGKGTDTIKKAHEMLTQSNSNYLGFVEGNEVLDMTCDLVVCNGFVGNAMTKLLESAVSRWKQSSSHVPRISKVARFIGISKPVYKCHGASTEAEFMMALEEVLAAHASVELL